VLPARRKGKEAESRGILQIAAWNRVHGRGGRRNAASVLVRARSLLLPSISVCGSGRNASEGYCDNYMSLDSMKRDPKSFEPLPDRVSSWASGSECFAEPRVCFPLFMVSFYF
jgi:hypothetical protein